MINNNCYFSLQGHPHGNLSDFAVNLSKSRSMINPSAKKVSKLSDMLPSLGEIVEKEHKRLLARKSIIEKIKEEQEHHLVEMVFIFINNLKLCNIYCYV